MPLNRHPKNWMQLIPPYMGVLLSVTLSVTFSVILFQSISEDSIFKALFAGLAIVFELAKFVALPEIARRKQRKDWGGTLSATLFFLVLAAASILGSIGGLQSDTQRVQASKDQTEERRQGLKEERQQKLTAIAQNNVSIATFSEMKRETNGAKPLKDKNEKFEKEAAELLEKINAITVPPETAITALFGAIATAIDADKEAVQVYVFILFAILLDISAGFFINLIREENDFRASYKKQITQTEEGATPPKTRKPKAKKSGTPKKEKPTPPKLTVVEKKKSGTPVEAKQQELQLPEDSNVVSIKRASALDKYADVKKAVSKLEVGKGVYKRRMMKTFQLGQKTVDKHYRWLVRDGLVVQDAETKLFYRAA